MNVKELYAYLDERIPKELSCDWDNDGLMCCPDPDRTVSKVLVALDATDAVTDEAIGGDFDAIITHHPLIFHPVERVDSTYGKGLKLVNLIRAGISVMSFHTRLDAVDGGVNDQLASSIGLIDVEKFDDGDGTYMGRIGCLTNKVGLPEFACSVRDALGSPAVLTAGAGLGVYRVAVLGGDGKSAIEAAVKAGADTFLSGRIGYNCMTEAEEYGINLVEAGHFYTEDPVCDRLCELVISADKTIQTIYMNSCNINFN